MSEKRAEYGIETELINPAIIICSDCGNIIGTYVLIDFYDKYQNKVKKRVWLKAGPLIIQALRGRCAQCGKSFDYDISERNLSRLIERVKRLR